MKKRGRPLICTLLGVSSLLAITNGSVTPGDNGGAQILIEESFQDLSAWKDLSKAVSWANQPPDGSAWETGGVLTLSPEGIDSVGLRPWEDVSRSRSFTAIDYQFPSKVAHRDNILTIEIRIRWASLISELRGEWNRINLMLVHEYPEAGLDISRDVKVYDFTHEWWGRPSYQLRIRGSNQPDGTALLMYGGGYDPRGEFEIYYDEYDDPLWWLPGFSSTAGASLSEGGPSPGVGTPWPLNGWTRSSGGLASLSWQRFRYVVAPDYQALFVDSDDDGLGWIMNGYMPLPETSAAPQTAPLYHYFESHEGLRVYFRGYENAEIDWLDAWVTPEREKDHIAVRKNGLDWILEFGTEPGKIYTPQVSNDLESWEPFGQEVEGDGKTSTINLGQDLGTENRFYRVLKRYVPDQSP